MDLYPPPQVLIWAFVSVGFQLIDSLLCAAIVVLLPSNFVITWENQMQSVY